MSGRRATRRGPCVELAFEGPIASITLARGESGNLLDDAAMHGLAEAVAAVAERDEVRVAVLRARGRAFSLGLPPAVAWPPRVWPDGIEAVARIAVPVIAVLAGEARGWGVSLALACDLRLMAAEATIHLPEAGEGRLPGGGATQRLARLVGPAKAAEICLLGTRLSGRQAAACGLATRAVPRRSLHRTARLMAGALARRGPLALRYAKEAVLRALDLPLEDGLRLEHDLYVLLQTTADRGEGVRAFLEHRPPRFAAR